MPINFEELTPYRMLVMRHDNVRGMIAGRTLGKKSSLFLLEDEIAIIYIMRPTTASGELLNGAALTKLAETFLSKENFNSSEISLFFSEATKFTAEEQTAIKEYFMSKACAYSKIDFTVLESNYGSPGNTGADTNAALTLAQQPSFQNEEEIKLIPSSHSAASALTRTPKFKIERPVAVVSSTEQSLDAASDVNPFVYVVSDNELPASEVMRSPIAGRVHPIKTDKTTFNRIEQWEELISQIIPKLRAERLRRARSNSTNIFSAAGAGAGMGSGAGSAAHILTQAQQSTATDEDPDVIYSAPEEKPTSSCSLSGCWASFTRGLNYLTCGKCCKGTGTESATISPASTVISQEEDRGDKARPVPSA
jgi:hypothetical protein